MASKFLKYLFILYFTFFSVSPTFASSISPLTVPTGGQVASGTININQSAPGKLVINQTTNQGIINWQSFNVGVDAAVHFNTPNATAGTLNNISGGSSTILGSIFSNGRLFFANPSGIIFKPGSQVKAEGLVASAMKISNQDFLSNNFNFTNNQIASLQNEGNLEAQYVALIAPQVLNKGTITTNVATMIAAGDDVKLSISDSNRLSVNINPAKIKTLSSNEGVIKSENGTVSIQANAAQELVDQTINAPRSADSLISENGVIKLVSSGGSIKSKKVNLSAGPLGGTEVSGTIDASSTAKGGDIEITGKEIQVKSNSTLLATGETGGGNILVGGDWQGSNGVLQATYTSVEKDTLIDASSKGIGDGGKIVVWSDIHNSNSKTVAQGKLYAKANIGDGGKIETSGYALNIENVDPNTLSIYGKAGNYLIDPYNYEIHENDWTYINNALSSSNITITTDGTNYGDNYGRSDGSGLSGRIAIHPGSRIYTGSRDAILTLIAANNVEINADISTNSNKLNIIANNEGVNATGVFGTGDLNLGGGKFEVNTSATTSKTYSGVLSNLSLTKSGIGNFILSGTNTYSGATTVSAGTLSVTGTLGRGTYAGNIANSGTLAMGSNSSQTLSGVVSGTGALTKSGSGTLTLSGANTYSGATTVSAGTLSVTGTLGSGTYAGNIANSGTLAMGSNSSQTLSGVVSRTGALTKSGSGTLTLSGTNTYSGGTTLTAGQISLGVNQNSSSTSGALGTGTLTMNGGTLGNTSSYGTIFNNILVNTGVTSTLKEIAGSNLHLAGNITGSGTLQVDNTSGWTVSLAGDNSGFTGTYIQPSSTVGNTGFLSSTAGSPNASWELSGGRFVNEVNGGNILLGSLSSNASSGYLLGSSGGNKNASYTIGGKNLDSTFTGIIENDYPNVRYNVLSITKTGTGTLNLSGTNTYTGATTVSAGTLSVTGTLGRGTYAGNIANSGTLAMGSSSSQTLSGVVSGTGALSKSGSGTLTLSGANTYSGATTVSAGKLDVYNSGGIGSGTLILNNGTTLMSSRRGDATTLNNNITLASGSITTDVSFGTSSDFILGGSISGDGKLVVVGDTNNRWLRLSGSNTFAGGVDINTSSTGSNKPILEIGSNSALGTGNVTSYGTSDDSKVRFAGSYSVANNFTTSSSSSKLNFDTNGQTGTVSGVISGSGTITKSGTGTLTLSGANTYSGATTVSAGTLSVTGTLGSGTYAGNIANSGTLAMGSSSNQTLSGVVSGTGALTKSGSGTLTLSGTNTYSGATTVSAGTLSLSVPSSNSARHYSPSYSISSGATLEYNTPSGTVNYSAGDVTYSGQGKIKKVGAGQIQWGQMAATFALGSGSLIDVQEGTFVGGSSGNEVWTNNLSNLNIASGANFYGVEAPIIIDALTGVGTIYTGYQDWPNASVTMGVNNTQAGTYNSSGSATFSGSIKNSDNSSSHPGKIIKSGSGTQILSGDNTYTGTTTVSAGTLSVTGTLGSGTYAGNIANSGTLAMGSSSNQTLSGVVSGTGALTKSGSGTLTLSGTNTYTGATTIGAGTLSASSLADTTALSVASGATYKLDQNDTVASIAGAGNINLQDKTLTSAGASDTTFSGIISGTGGLTLTGSNNLTLSGANAYSGATHTNGGGLILANSNALASNSITSTSGRLKTTERISNLTVIGAVNLIGDIATTGAQTYSNNVTIGAGSAANPLTISSQNSDITFSGTVKTGSGAKAAQRSLTVNAGTGNVTFNDRVGYDFNGITFNPQLTADSPYALSVTGGNITLKGDVMTFETQTYNGAVKIGRTGSNGTTRTLLSMDPKITFNGTVDDTQANTHTLVAKAVQIRDNVLASGAPEVNFNRPVSSVTKLQGYQGLTGYQIVSNEFGSIDGSASFGTVKLPPSPSSPSSGDSSQSEQRNIERKISSLKANIAKSSSNTKTGMTLSQMFSSFKPQAGTSFVKSIEIVYLDSPNFGAGKINQNLPADVKSNNNLNQNKSNQTKPNNQLNQKQNSSGEINDDDRL